MRKTYQSNKNGNQNDKLIPIAVDTEGLQFILGCGRPTAIEIGTLAQARVVVGKRVIWNIEKVQKYLNSVCTS